jgi:hypothetical protein
MVIAGSNQLSTSGMAIAALSFLVQHVAYRLKLSKKNSKSSQALKAKVNLSMLFRFGAWQLLSNSKF